MSITGTLKTLGQTALWCVPVVGEFSRIGRENVLKTGQNEKKFYAKQAQHAFSNLVRNVMYLAIVILITAAAVTASLVTPFALVVLPVTAFAMTLLIYQIYKDAQEFQTNNKLHGGTMSAVTGKYQDAATYKEYFCDADTFDLISIIYTGSAASNVITNQE